MKKVSLLLSMASIILASNSNVDINKINENFDFCKLGNKKVDIYVKGPFGKQKKTISLLEKYEDYFLKHLDNPKIQKALILLKIQAFFYNTKDFYFKRLISSSSDDFVYKTSFFESITRGLISLGYLPSSFELNVASLQTKSSKITMNYSTVDLAMNLAFYLFPGDLQKALYRNLLFDSFALSKGLFLTSSKCEDMEANTFKQTLLILSLFAKKKDPVSIRILYYLVNKDYNELDKFLLKNKEIANLMRYAENVIKTKYSKYLN